MICSLFICKIRYRNHSYTTRRLRFFQNTFTSMLIYSCFIDIDSFFFQVYIVKSQCSHFRSSHSSCYSKIYQQFHIITCIFVYTLVNANSNKSRLKTIPYRMLKGTDLAITYKIIIDIDLWILYQRQIISLRKMSATFLRLF